jgi:hypothetical protein
LAAVAVVGFLAASALGDDRGVRGGFGSGGSIHTVAHRNYHGHHGHDYGHRGYDVGHHGYDRHHRPPVIIVPPHRHPPVIYSNPWAPPIYGYPSYGHGCGSGFSYQGRNFGFSFGF